MKRLAPFVIYVCIALFACKKEEPPSKVDSGLLAQVVGRYEWISTQATLQDYGSPPYGQYKVATDSTDRFGILILGSGEVVLYKNQTITHSGNVSATTANADGSISIYCQLVSGGISMQVKGNGLTCGGFPYSWSSGPGINRFMRLSTNVSLSVEHGQPDCSAGYVICGSYTGIDTSWTTTYPFVIISSGQKTYQLAPGNALACDVYVLDENGHKVYTVLNTPGYSVTVKDSILRIEKYWYTPHMQMCNYSFVGIKD